MNLGIPYKGSKNTIAVELVAKLPPAHKVLDACCGGGAVLMALAQSLKYDKVVGNDLNPATIKLLDAVLINKGQIEYEHPEPCTRVDFFNSLQRIENGDFSVQDCVNKYCASFGNNGQTYLWNEDIEKVKIEVEKMLCSKTLNKRRLSFRSFISQLIDNSENLTKLENIQQLQNLERLQRLERLERLDIFDIDYSEFDLVYFDIPYKGTAKYDFDFDYERFYDLFRSLEMPAFMSEYDAPFECVAEFDKRKLFRDKSRVDGNIEGLEKLYFNGTKDEYKELMGRFCDENATQTTLF